MKTVNDIKKRRDESFFGLHFDFHAGRDQKNIGENCDPDTIERLINEVRPDYIQCDTKGHRGATSYPTKVGYQANDMKGDILRMWRDVTAKYNVALYAHHSGVWDDLALEHNPEWAAVDADGNASKQKMSVFGPYAEKLLIPQMLEMALDYELDGIWVDGECWAVMIDYSSYAIEEYKKRYNEDPPRPDDENYNDYLKFCRQGFRDYINYYVTEVHKKAPEFQIASNWMYTSFVPEDVAIPVDFLSGDYSPNDSINTARFEGRCLQNQKKSWDLMAWCFSTVDGIRCVKTYEQMCQEAAAVIMLGGGFQFYNKQLVGTVQDWAIPMWAELAKFCRAREEICFKAKPVPQVGIVYSEKAFYKNKKDLFTCYTSKYADDMRGLLYAVLDNQYSAEILMTHHLMYEKPLEEYGVIILPDLEAIESDLKEKLLEYVSNGGNLIVTGHSSVQLLLPYLDIDIKGVSEDVKPVYVRYNNNLAPLKTTYAEVVAGDKVKTLGEFYFNDSPSGEPNIAATVTNYGNGKIAGIYFNTGAYQRNKSMVVRDFIGSVINEVFTPSVKVYGSRQIEVSLMRKDDKLCVNLLNVSGNHSDIHYMNFDEITPLSDITVEIVCESEPRNVYIEPEHKAAVYTYENGKITVKLDKLHIHTIITIE